MPTIIVQAESTEGGSHTLTLVERAIPACLQSDHYLDQLVERLAWAILDAERLESSPEHPNENGRALAQGR
jgi:hypothetical protein